MSGYINPEQSKFQNQEPEMKQKKLLLRDWVNMISKELIWKKTSRLSEFPVGEINFISFWTMAGCKLFC